ncbi:MAG: TonB-dependent receptor [Colwellia sp.]|nr:TonB-dependent receptor [Colwellia sp.]
MFLKNTSLAFNSLVKSKISTACSVCLSITALSYSAQALAQNISGKVVDQQGKAVKSATVSIISSDRVVTTDAQGFFTFSDLSEGKFELHASAKNYAHSNQHINLKQADISGVTITLSPSVMEVLDVYATPLHSSTIESALPVNVISGDDLKLKQASTLGETLKNEVGVHSNFYGSVTSSPIIRGLDGPRVLITQNGLDAGDASRVGADHAVATETSTATQIEVLRGPATLFYGSGAIGGVVNVVDNRVPTSSEALAEWLLQYNDVSDERQGSFSLQNGMQIAGNEFAVHLDAFWRDAGNYKLPADFDAHAHEEEHDEGDHEEEHEEHDEEHEETPSHLENSASKSHGFTVGTSYLFDQGFVGFSYGKMNRDYGIPGHAHHGEDEHEEDEHEEHEEGTQAKMEQDRLQMLSEVYFAKSFINQLSTKFAYTDYQHQEIEEGEVGTTFSNKSTEFKTDLYHQEYQGWKGAWTFHYKNSDFKAVGEEAFTPASNTDSFAIAWLEEKHYDNLLFQLGARIEQVNVEAKEGEIELAYLVHEDEHEEEHHDDEHHLELKEQNFTPISLSTGLVWTYQEGYNVGMSLALSQRAPSAAELFSFGPHIGTNTFEVGAMYEIEQEGDEIHVELSSNAPEIETSYSFDLTWRKFEGDFGFVVSAFYNHVDDYYYQQDTGLVFEGDHEHALDDHEEESDEESEGLPILIYQQDDVDMYGIEAELVYQISSPLRVSLFGDYIHAKLANGSYLPRTPPMRIGTSLNYQGSSYDGELSVNHYASQNDIAPLETTTPAYTMIDMNFNYYIDGIGNDMVLYVKGQNLTDEVARVHSSFLKNVSPLPGRSFSLGIRGSF